MPPKKATAQPVRVSSRPKPVPAETAPSAQSPDAGKRKADENADPRATKKRSTAPKAAAPATKTPKAPAASKSKTTTASRAKPISTSKSKSAATPKPKASPTTSEKTKSKRKSDDVAEAPTKRARTAAPKKMAEPKSLPVINTVPTEKLDVFVMGEGESGELGLGNAPKISKGVKRPRLHPLLSTGDIDVVHMATGGMHAAALTASNQILTWGVNDNGACGRDTTWEGGLKDMDAPDTDASSGGSEDSDDEDNGLNPKEATPTAIPSEHFPKGTKFVQLVAGDSCTFALTTEGLVYGWGTFRDNNGVLGFRPDVETARSPMLVPELKNIKHLVCGNNHALALDTKGNVFVWGAGEQNQLGRRIVERTRLSCLIPREMGLPKKQTKYVASGGEHSFAITKNDKVYAWGLNNYGQTGIPENAGADEAVVPVPTIVKQLSNYKMTQIEGGGHHTLAITDSGDCLAWGRATGGQIGIAIDTLPEQDVIREERAGKVGILKKPTAIPGLKCKYVATSSDHSIAITTEGKAYSWGFSALFQTGQGTEDDINVATLIDNTAVRNRVLNWAGTGGQYSVLTSAALASTNTSGSKTGSSVPATTAVNGTSKEPPNTVALNEAAAKKTAKLQNNANAKTPDPTTSASSEKLYPLAERTNGLTDTAKVEREVIKEVVADGLPNGA